MPEKLDRANTVINYTFTMYFLVEMIMKLIGLSPAVYVKDNMNIFDGLVVLSSIAEMAMDISPTDLGACEAPVA